jgi:BirA family biotin operon repressor/biotin-[acetyl-CoA-carboxylase] ligase
MKGQILNVLRVEKGIVSGEALSSSLGISRVSIWKHIKKLREPPDIPFPWEFPDREGRLFYFPVVNSTMEIAKDLARKGCPHFTVIVADRQKKGRGRLNRKWRSDAGGLYFTMVLRPSIPIVLSARISFLASLTLTRVLRDMFDVDASVKWPNDILVNDYKIAGMLTEIEAEADRVHFLNIGIGININNDPSRSEPRASSLKKILDRQISRNDLLSRFLDDLESQMKQVDFDCIVSEWKKYTITLNRRVRIVTTQETSEGIAVDVDDNGALILETSDGSLKKILYGDCFHDD